MLGLFVRKHALAATEAGFRVTVVYAAPGLTGKSRELFSTDIQSAGLLTEVRVSYRKAEGLSGMARQLIAWNLAVKTAVQQQGRPDLIHAHILTRVALLSCWLAYKWKVPCVITEHWSRYYPENMQYKGWLRRFLTERVVKRAQAVTVVSNRLANAMKAQGLQFATKLLPNVVDTAVFKPAEKYKGPFRIVSITCFEEKSKNLKMLVDAVAHIATHRHDIELVMIGDGNDYDLIKKYVAGKHMRYKTVRFTGVLQDHELAEELQQATCLALTSNYETFGIVAFEALACGIPVVATDVADLAVFINEENGKIVKTGDAEILAVELENVLNRLPEYKPSDMHKRVEAELSSRAVAEKLKELYISAIGNIN